MKIGDLIYVDYQDNGEGVFGIVTEPGRVVRYAHLFHGWPMKAPRGFCHRAIWTFHGPLVWGSIYEEIPSKEEL